MGDVVKFNKKSYSLKYDEVLSSDPYLRTTALNGLKKAGYYLTNAGVTQFQRDNGLPETGILSINEIPALMLQFEPETRQGIINYLERVKMSNEKDDKNNKLLPIILTLLGILFFEVYGIISCFFDIVNLIKK